MSEPRIMVSPPQYTLWRKLAYSFGADPEVAVREPYEKNKVTIIEVVVQGNRVPAVAGVLKNHYNFGGIEVIVVVLDDGGNKVEPPDLTQPDFSVRQMIETALFANPYFYRVVAAQAPSALPRQVLTAVFYPKVIQFWNDDLSDYYGYTHFVAQEVFADVMRKNYDDGTELKFTTIASRTFL